MRSVACLCLVLCAFMPTPSRAQASEDLERARRSLVTVECSGTFSPTSLGFAFGDRRTVIAPAGVTGCRRGARVRGLGSSSWSTVSRAFGGARGFVRLELTEPLEPDVIPLQPRRAIPPHEGERLVVFRAPPDGELEAARAHLISEDPFEVRLDSGYAPAGTPIVDEQGKLVGVLPSVWAGRDEEGNAVGLDPLMEIVTDPPPEVAVRRALTGGGNLTGAGFVEPGRIGGIGFELDLELAFDDEWSLATSVAAFGLGPEQNSFSGYRFQHEVRGGYRLFTPTIPGAGFVVDLSVGAAVGYDRLPELTPGEDGQRWWVRPTARLSLRWALLNVGYAFYLDPEDPAASAHQVQIGFVMEP